MFWSKFSHTKYKAYNKSFKDVTKIFEECGILASKVLHFCASGTDLFGFRGISKTQIATINKHIIDKLGDVYMSELVKGSMKNMTGFPKQNQ